MPKISQEDYQQRLDRLTEIFADIVSHADEQATHRCPYRDARDRCTAAFSCGNQIAAVERGEPATCGHDGTFDYSLAWETDPATRKRAKTKLSAIKRAAAARREGQASPTGPGTVSHDGKTEPLAVGMTLFDCADELAVEVPTSCQRNGRCHECVVEVSAGDDALCARTEAEGFLRAPYRLACQALVERDDIDVAFAPLRRRPRILVRAHADAAGAPGTLDPLVTRRGDNVLYDGEVVDRYRGHMLGLAVDLGTTTVVLDFVDLETGKSVHSAAFENPQAFGGSDVMHRISYDREDKAGELQKAAASAINRAIVDGCARLGTNRQAIYEIVVAANPTMRDILFKLDVQGIGQKPYKSTIEHAFLAGEREHTALSARALRLGLRANRAARVYGLPLIASHVGGDAAAALVALEGGFADADTAMLVDMGTNTEVVLKHRGRMLAASCPAGPAFEGGLVRYGMPACDGAIEAVRLGEDGKAACKTIGGKDPVGVCGSGLIDLLAELRRADVLTAKGVFTADRKQKEMTVVPEHGITFSKEDASNLGQAKAANYCGQYIVMRALGVDPAGI
ncbi:MAG: ASKHA domain-containing protein, partial [Rhodospirillaceae bacterium]|nr:ASKHA domain-containing protein [Rhodospirillaceae bacterium]